MADPVDLVGKLLAKAYDAAASPHEAAAYRDAALRLMVKHDIDEALLRKPGTPDDPIEATAIAVVAPYSGVFATMFHHVAEALGCRTVLSVIRGPGREKGRTLHVFGRRSALRRAEMLATSLRAQSLAELAAAVASFTGNKRRWSRSFLIGFDIAVTERIEALHRQARDEMEPGDADRYALVRVCDLDRAKALADETFPDTVRSRPTRYWLDGGEAGHAAGRRADIGQTAVGNRLAIGS